MKESHRERQIVYEESKKAKLTETDENGAYQWLGIREKRAVRTSSYKMNKSWGCSVWHNDYS